MQSDKSGKGPEGRSTLKNGSFRSKFKNSYWIGHENVFYGREFSFYKKQPITFAIGSKGNQKKWKIY